MTKERRSSFQYRTRAVFKTPYKSSYMHHQNARDHKRFHTPPPAGTQSCESSYTSDRTMPCKFEKAESYQSSLDASDYDDDDDESYMQRSTYYNNGDKRHRVISTLNTLRNSWMSYSSDSDGQDSRYWKRGNDSHRNPHHNRSFESINLNDDGKRSRPLKEQKKRDGNRKCRTIYYVSVLLNVLMMAFLVYYMFFFQEKKTQNWNPYFEAPSTSPTISSFPTGVFVTSMPSSASTQPNITQNIVFDFNVTCPYDVNNLLGAIQNEIENITDSFRSVQIDIDIVSAPECLSRRAKQLRLLEQLIVRIQIMIKSSSLSSEEMNNLFEQLEYSILESIPGSIQVRSNIPISYDGTQVPSLSPSTVSPSTVSPSTVSPSTVSLSTVSPSTVSLSTVSPSTVSPSTVSPSLSSQIPYSFKPSISPSLEPTIHVSSALPSEHPTAPPSAMPSTVPSNMVSKSPSFEPSISIMPTVCDSSEERRDLLRSLIQNTSGIDYGSQNVLLSLEFSLDNDIYVNSCYDNSRLLQRYFVASSFISWGLSRHLSYVRNECSYGGIQIICNSEGNPMIINGEERQLKGTIPRELMFLNSISELNLGWNQMNGTVPDDLHMLSMLEVFDIKNNAITGEFPTVLLQLKHLRKIDLGHLKLNGTVPEELGTLTKLEILDLQHTMLTGTLPQSVLDLPHLETIRIFGSQLRWP